MLKKNWNRTKIRFDQDLSFLEANGAEQNFIFILRAGTAVNIFQIQFKRSIKIKHTIVIVKVAREGGSFIINRNKNNKSRVIYGETFRTFHRNFPHPSNHHFCTTDLKLTRKNQKNTAGNINICQSSYLTILIIHIWNDKKD